MSNTATAQCSAKFPPRLWYATDLLPRIQATLRELADLELRFEAEKEQLLASTAMEADRRRRIADIEKRRGAERRACERRLAELQGFLVVTEPQA